MFSHLLSRLRLSLGTAVLLALCAGLSVGVYVLSERTLKAEARADSLEIWRKDMHRKAIREFLKEPDTPNWLFVEKTLRLEADAQSELWNEMLPERAVQCGPFRIFGINEEDTWDAPPSGHRYDSNPSYLCFLKADHWSTCFVVAHSYRIQKLEVSFGELTVTLDNKGNFGPIRATVPLSDSLDRNGLSFVFAKLERQFHAQDPEYFQTLDDLYPEEEPETANEPAAPYLR